MRRSLSSDASVPIQKGVDDLELVMLQGSLDERGFRRISVDEIFPGTKTGIQFVASTTASQERMDALLLRIVVYNNKSASYSCEHPTFSMTPLIPWYGTVATVPFRGRPHRPYTGAGSINLPWPSRRSTLRPSARKPSRAPNSLAVGRKALPDTYDLPNNSTGRPVTPWTT